jgi:DNA-binding NtrC family response regulator
MTHRKILVVDDEKNIRLMLRQTLADEMTTVDTAVNGEEALQKLEQTNYDLVLLDLRLPGMDGLAVLSEVHRRYVRLPVILLTAHGTVDGAVEAMRGGAVNFLQKPFSPREIREAVEAACVEIARSDAMEEGKHASPRDDPRSDDLHT